MSVSVTSVPRSRRPAGRPRGFDAQAALEAAVAHFWERGYADTSLDDLVIAMGIGRSSFYALFGSKHAVMMAALSLYNSRLQERLAAAAATEPDPRVAVLRVLELVACTQKPIYGCLFVNSVSELAPRDAEVRAQCDIHQRAVGGLVIALLRRAGFRLAAARKQSGALLSLAIGLITLRKSGASERHIRDVLVSAAQQLLAQPSEPRGV